MKAFHQHFGACAIHSHRTQRGRTMLGVVKNVAKLLKVMRNYTDEYGVSGVT